MDALKTALRSILSADAVLTALVGDRIRPDELHEDDVLPAVIFEVPEEEAVEDLADTSDAGTATLAVSCCAHTAAAAGAIAAEVRRILDGYRGEQSGIELDPVTYRSTDRDQRAAEDGSDDADVWFVVPQFTVWFRT